MQKPESDGLDLALSSWEYKMSGYQRGKTFSSDILMGWPMKLSTMFSQAHTEKKSCIN